MSVTVSDLLALPSLRGSQVIAGQKGLSRIITSVSVLEYAQPTFLQDALFHNNEFYGSEIVITAFANIPDDVEAQCANIRRLAEAGEVGLILYYVGILMKRVDPRLIQLANELDFVLIRMPVGRMDLRYSEVIGDVMEAIFWDRTEHTALNTELLELISRLPSHQRTVDTVLKLLSDRLHFSLLLMGAGRSVLNAAAWPRTAAEELVSALPSLTLPESGAGPARLELLGGAWLFRLPVTADGRPLDLLLFSSGDAVPDPSLISQAGELVQLAVNLWGGSHDQVAATELVRAILLDEPMKMRRLAEIFRVDVASIHTMWIIHPLDSAGKEKLHSAIEPVRRLAYGHVSTVLCDLYEGDLFLFMDGPATLPEGEELCQALEETLDELGIQAVTTQCGAQATTTMVRAAFLSNQQNLELARRVFPGRRHYSIDEVDFAGSCGAILAAGEDALAQATAVLDPLRGLKDGPELLHTLAVCLLDCNGGVTQTARVLYLHPNTVKYRLRRLSDLLGRRVDQMPAAMVLYRAAALERLLQA